MKQLAEMATNKEKREQGKLLFKRIPKVKKPWPYILFIINIILPGIGTLIAAFMCKKEEKKKFNILCGLGQFFLSIILIGWIWSIVWGYFIYRRGTGLFQVIPDV